MDVTFVLEESGATATVEVPCDANVAAAKRVACTVLAISPASVEVRVGTEVVEGTCRLQDTAIGAGVQVVLACPTHANVRCPAEYKLPFYAKQWALSQCGGLCVALHDEGSAHGVARFSYLNTTDTSRTKVLGFDTESFDTLFDFTLDMTTSGAPAISRCKTRCYLACREHFVEIALPSGDVLHTVKGSYGAVYASGRVVLARGDNHVAVYDEDLTFLRSLTPNLSANVVVSKCGAWVLTSSRLEVQVTTFLEERVSLWDTNTGVAVASVMAEPGSHMAVSETAAVFALCAGSTVRLYDWGGAPLCSFKVRAAGMQFTPCGQYFVLDVRSEAASELHQYEVDSMSCVRVVSQNSGDMFAISSSSNVIIFQSAQSIVTKRLYPE